MAKNPDRDGVYKVKIEPNLDLIRMWTRDGISLNRICDALGVSRHLVMDLAKVHAPLWEALRVSREMIDLSLVDSLYKRAAGYTAVTTTREWVYRYNADGSVRDRRISKEKEIEVHVPGDPRLLEFWLSKRMPDEWGPTQAEIESGSAGVVYLTARGDIVPAGAGAGAKGSRAIAAPDIGGPGGVPGENGERKLYGAPLLDTSPQNTSENHAKTSDQQFRTVEPGVIEEPGRDDDLGSDEGLCEK